MPDTTDIRLSCIYSLPRSGSTVLTAELDRFEGVVCVPEAYFPQILAFLPEQDLASRQTLARVFLATCDAGFSLSLAELESAIVPGHWRETFVEIGLRCAEKAGRDRESVKAIVWKSTRMLTGYAAMRDAGARFVILRRNPINVFDSQFRVGFGIHNRNPLRFAAFRQSYEALFYAMRRFDVFELDYESIPNELPALVDWLGGRTLLRREGGSTMADTMARHDWHSGLLDGFNSTDAQKRKNVALWQRAAFWGSTAAFSLMRPYWYAKRRRYDERMSREKRDNSEQLATAQT